MNLVIKSGKNKEELLYILKNNVEEKQNSWFQRVTSDSLKCFNGSVNEDGSFKISRTIKYNNSFLPIIDGNIVDDGNNAVVNISMHYHPIVLAFIVIWFIFVLIACIVFPFQNFDGMPFIFRFIPYFMLVAGAIICIVPYKIEANIAKTKLVEMLGE